MSTSLRVALTVMCGTFAAVGLVTLNETLAGVGGGLGIALIAVIVENAMRERRERGRP